MFERKITNSLLLAGVCLAGTCGHGWACNVPVFRYALEHWRPDPYRLTIVHRGPLSESQQAEIDQTRDRAVATHLNVVVQTVDADRLANESQPVPATDLPRLVVQYPAGLRIDRPVANVPFTSESLVGWLDSPLRREIIRKLVLGQTAVWVLVTTGDAALDEPAAKLLDEELSLLSRKLKLPELTESPEDVLLGSTPLKISFSRLTVRRDDPAEQALVAMLLGCEDDLATTDEPMVFPVFGRCRVLLPLIGAGITAENLQTSAAFLTGACSCQVKNQNPGFDLLHTADWARELVLDSDPAVTIASDLAAEPQLVPIPLGSAIEPPVSTSSDAAGTPASRPQNSTQNLVAGIVLVIVLLGALSAILIRR